MPTTERDRHALRLLRHERSLWDQKRAKLQPGDQEADFCAERYEAIDRIINLLQIEENRAPCYLVLHLPSGIGLGVYQVENAQAAILEAIRGRPSDKTDRHGKVDSSTVRAYPIAPGDCIELANGAVFCIEELSMFSSWLRAIPVNHYASERYYGRAQGIRVADIRGVVPPRELDIPHFLRGHTHPRHAH